MIGVKVHGRATILDLKGKVLKALNKENIATTKIICGGGLEVKEI